jgi:hypothetical protein
MKNRVPIFCCILKKGENNAQRIYLTQSGGKTCHNKTVYIRRIICSPLEKELGISDGSIRKRKRQYLTGGEMALENQRKPGKPTEQIYPSKGTKPRGTTRIPSGTAKEGTDEKRS